MSISSVLKWMSLHFCLRSKPDSLKSISSVKEEMDNVDKKNRNYEKTIIMKTVQRKKVIQNQTRKNMNVLRVNNTF